MQIPIRDPDEFHRLLLALVDELVDAQIHFNLNQDLAAVMPEYVTEFNQSWTFWSLTLNAHMDAVLLRLCKAYDQTAETTRRSISGAFWTPSKPTCICSMSRTSASG